MKRTLPLLLAATLVSACGGARHASGSYVIDYRPHVPRSNVTPLANRRARRAGREAAKLLKRLPLPPGAVRLPAPAPTDQLAQSGLGVSIVSMTADRFSVWRVPASGQAVIAFERRHILSGLHGDGVGSSPDGWASEEFYGPTAGGSPRYAVSVTVVPSGGQTRVRLDAGVAWIYPRSPSEDVPAGVREIEIHGGGVSRRVTAAAQVKRIVRWFDALNVSQPGPSVAGCPAILAASVNFSFRSSRGAELASADVPSVGPTNNCDPIEFGIHGKQSVSLIDNRSRHTFVDRVQRLLGVRFRVPRPGSR